MEPSGTRVSKTAAEPRRVAVTGGAGHFGQLVMARLLADPGTDSVVCLDVVPPDLVHDRLAFRKADVRDPEIGRHFEGVDTVVHLAFLISRYRPRELYDSINVEGSKNVFRAAAAAGVAQVVYASSVAVYGLVRSHPVPIVEDTPRVHQPDFSYNDAKWRVEAFLDDFEREHPELIVTRLRMVAALGPGQESAMGRALRRGVVPSTSDVPWPIVWADDVADAFLLAIAKRARGAFNLSTDEPMSAKQLAAATGLRHLHLPRWLGVAAARLSPLAQKLGLGAALDPAWIKYSDAVLVLSSEKAVRELGWKRRCPTALSVMQRVKAEVTGVED